MDTQIKQIKNNKVMKKCKYCEKKVSEKFCCMWDMYAQDTGDKEINNLEEFKKFYDKNISKK